MSRSIQYFLIHQQLFKIIYNLTVWLLHFECKQNITELLAQQSNHWSNDFHGLLATTLDYSELITLIRLVQTHI